MCSVGPRFGGAAVRIGACRKAEAVNPKANPPSSNLRNGRRKRQPAEGNPEAEGRRTNPPSRSANSPRVIPKRCVPKSGSREPEGQPTERQPRSGACRKAEAMSPKANSPSGNLRNGACRKAEAEARRPTRRGQFPKRKAEEPTRPAATPKRRMPKSGSGDPEGQLAERKPESKRQPRAVKTTQGERSPSAGRSRETRGRRSSADTPTNTIEKRNCDTLRPSEAS